MDRFVPETEYFPGHFWKVAHANNTSHWTYSALFFPLEIVVCGKNMENALSDLKHVP